MSIKVEKSKNLYLDPQKLGVDTLVGNLGLSNPAYVTTGFFFSVIYRIEKKVKPLTNIKERMNRSKPLKLNKLVT